MIEHNNYIFKMTSSHLKINISFIYLNFDYFNLHVNNVGCAQRCWTNYVLLYKAKRHKLTKNFIDTLYNMYVIQLYSVVKTKVK